MKVAQEKAREEAYKREVERQRRPSRFQVSPAPDVLFVRQMSEQYIDKVRYIGINFSCRKPVVQSNRIHFINYI